MSWIVRCANCGQQVFTDGDHNENCYFCGKPKFRKEVTKMENQKSETLPPVPPRPKGRKRLAKYFEENKEPILRDYKRLKLREFLKRWHLAPDTWMRLKALWGIKGKKPVQSEHQKSRSKLQTTRESVHQTDKKIIVLYKQDLPPLPAFNDSWLASVQEKWLEVYARLAEAAK